MFISSEGELLSLYIVTIVFFFVLYIYFFYFIQISTASIYIHIYDKFVVIVIVMGKIYFSMHARIRENIIQSLYKYIHSNIFY